MSAMVEASQLRNVDLFLDVSSPGSKEFLYVLTYQPIRQQKLVKPLLFRTVVKHAIQTSIILHSNTWEIWIS